MIWPWQNYPKICVSNFFHKIVSTILNQIQFTEPKFDDNFFGLLISKAIDNEIFGYCGR